MPRPDVAAMATEVVLLVKTALGPVLERLAASEQSTKDLHARVLELIWLRDRVVTLETKAATPHPALPEPVPVDLGPVLERISGAEARLSVLCDVRDRLVTVETKAAIPIVVPDTTDAILRQVEERFRVSFSGPIAKVETAQSDLCKDMGTLRERLVTVEAKAALPALPLPLVESVPVDLTPVFERLAAAEAHLAVLGDLRDRVVTVETKAAMSPQPDPVLIDLVSQIKAVDNRTGFLIAEMTNRIAATEDRVVVLDDLRDRVVTVEAKAANHVLPLPQEAGVDDLRDRLVSLETKAAGPSLSDMGLTELRTQFTTVQAKVFEVSERVAVVETRPLLPGPQGDPGQPGTNGIDGKDGTAGLTYVGVYQDGKAYDVGDVATWAGSTWHCNEPTDTKPGDGSKAWTLMVKRGRDGRDGVVK